MSYRARSTVASIRAAAPPRGAPAVVLAVAGDATLLQVMRAAAEGTGLVALTAADLGSVRRIALQVVPDLLVVDTDSVPGAGMRELAELWRACAPTLPALALLCGPAAHCESQGPWAREAAVTCLHKPLQARALGAALRSLAQRGGSEGQPADPPAVLPGVEVERSSPLARIRSAGTWLTLQLPRTEHRLLLALVDAHPRVVDRERLQRLVWGDRSVSARTVDQYVKRLRETLERAGRRGLVRTAVGSGYRIEPHED